MPSAAKWKNQSEVLIITSGAHAHTRTLPAGGTFASSLLVAPFGVKSRSADAAFVDDIACAVGGLLVSPAAIQWTNLGEPNSESLVVH